MKQFSADFADKLCLVLCWNGFVSPQKRQTQKEVRKTWTEIQAIVLKKKRYRKINVTEVFIRFCKTYIGGRAGARNVDGSTDVTVLPSHERFLLISQRRVLRMHPSFPRSHGTVLCVGSVSYIVSIFRCGSISAGGCWGRSEDHHTQVPWPTQSSGAVSEEEICVRLAIVTR